MKRMLISTLFILFLGTYAAASPYDNIHIDPYKMQEIVANSYIRGVIAQGDVTRWNKNSFPLKVYVQQEGVPDYYVVQIKKAYSKWQNVTGGEISFTYVSSRENADMKCYFLNSLPNTSEDTAGFHQFKYYGNKIADSVIRFRIKDKYGNYLNEDLIYNVALHEIGHSLGLAGHSSQKSDLMYPISMNRNYDISLRDLTTLKLLYSMVPDVTDTPLSSEEENRLLTKVQVVGGEERLKQDAETAAKINTKITPGDPSSKLRLAEAYKANGNYTAAINEYKSIVPLVDSSELKSALYAEVANCYIKLKNYTAAQNCANYVNTNYPTQVSRVLTPKIMYSKGAKSEAVNQLASILRNDNRNEHAVVLLKQI